MDTFFSLPSNSCWNLIPQPTFLLLELVNNFLFINWMLSVSAKLTASAFVIAGFKSNYSDGKPRCVRELNSVPSVLFKKLLRTNSFILSFSVSKCIPWKGTVFKVHTKRTDLIWLSLILKLASFTNWFTLLLEGNELLSLISISLAER